MDQLDLVDVNFFSKIKLKVFEHFFVFFVYVDFERDCTMGLRDWVKGYDVV